VPTGKHVGLDAEPVTSDPAVQTEREEAFVPSSENADPRCRPRREFTHGLKCDVRLEALMPLALGREFGVDIVKEVCLHVEGTVATRAGRLLLGLERARTL